MKEAIYKTLCYADIFDFPLKVEEIWRYLIADPKSRSKKLDNSQLNLFGHKDDYYFLPGREKLVAIRKKREVWSAQKLTRAQKIAQLLKVIPTLKMVGITGALACGNSKEEDDIDLFLVTSGGTLWLTRFLTTVLVEITGQRRYPSTNPTQVKDKICLNMFVSEDNLTVPKVEQDLYTAHEVVQLRSLWDRGGVYQKFLAANLWVRKYLPNTLSTTNIDTKNHGKKVSGSSCLSSWLLVFEWLAKKLQLWYMARRRTTEVINEGIIRFHPQDARAWVLREYKSRLQKYLNFGA